MFQFGIRNSFVSTSYTHKFKLNETRVKLGVRLTLLGSMLEYGCETRVSKHSILGASMSVGNASGVALRLKYNFTKLISKFKKNPLQTESKQPKLHISNFII